jgi:mannose-6-phosphate isomerase
MKMYPLKFEPIFRHYIWGGHKLREVLGKKTPEDKRTAESWELADLPEAKSVIKNGPLAGQTLAETLDKYGKEITGRDDYAGPFGLLIKFLDAQDILSVQVHPDAEACRRLGKGDLKTECWYIISAEPGAIIYKGLKKGTTKDTFAEAINKGTVEELLSKIEVRAGQCHFMPAGTVHSMGPGVLAAEIQTPSDTTFRVFDWNRVDDKGQGRPIHIKEALESIHFDVSGDEFPVTTTGRLVECEYFKVDKEQQGKKSEVIFSQGTMRILMILAGKGTITGDESEAVNFSKGDTILIPAEFEGIMKFDADTEYLVVSL